MFWERLDRRRAGQIKSETELTSSSYRLFTHDRVDFERYGWCRNGVSRAVTQKPYVYMCVFELDASAAEML